jgi:hypothetical protein
MATSKDHPIASAVGKTLGTVAAKIGLAGEPEPKERLPRKLKKARKKEAVKQTAEPTVPNAKNRGVKNKGRSPKPSRAA